MKRIIIIIAALSALGSCRPVRVVTETQVVERVRDSVVVQYRDTVITITPEPTVIEVVKLIPVPSEITTDTLWVKGRFSDAYGLIRASELRVGMVEGKEFDLTIEDAIKETRKWRDMYYSEKQQVVTTKPSNRWAGVKWFVIGFAFGFSFMIVRNILK